jgi:starch synthase
MHVGFVTPRYPPTEIGGGEISARLFAENIRQNPRVDDLSVLSFDGRGEETYNDVPIRRFGTPSSLLTEWQNLRAYTTLREVVSEFDLIHAYNMELNPAVGVATQRAGVPAVASLNSYHFFKQSLNNVEPDGLQRLYELVGYPTTGRFLRGYMKRIDAFLAASRAVKEIYQEHGFGGQRIKVVPIMTDPEFEPPVREPTDETCSLLYVGRLAPNKGVRHLIKAMAHLDSNYRLQVVGDGPERSALESRREQYGLEDRIEFTGRVPYDQVKSHYARADVFVHPGVWPEPFNRTLLEAMLSELPIVCTNIGGPPEAIPQSELLCEPGDPESLASAVQRAWANRNEIGVQNRSHVLESYTPETVVPDIVNLYEEVIS